MSQGDPCAGLADIKARFLDEKDELKWFVFGYGSTMELEVLESGESGWEEFVEALAGVSSVSYGLIHMQQDDHAAANRFKNVLATWTGKEMGREHRTLLLSHSGPINMYFQGIYHVHVSARNRKDDLGKEHVLSLVKKASGADYDSGATDKAVVETTGEGKQNVKFSRAAPRGGRRLMRKGRKLEPLKMDPVPEPVAEPVVEENTEPADEQSEGDSEPKEEEELEVADADESSGDSEVISDTVESDEENESVE